MPVAQLYMGWCPVKDLTPLRGKAIDILQITYTGVTDLSPLRDTKIKSLMFDVKPERDAEILRSIPGLETINGKPAAEVLK